MIKDKELVAIERKAYKAFLSDGLIEITWGLMFLAYGFAEIFHDNSGMRISILLAFFLPAFSFLVIGKKRITAKRLGVVRFGAARISRRNITYGITLIAVLITWGLWAVMANDLTPGSFIAKWGVDIAVLCIMLVIAIMLDYITLFFLGFIMMSNWFIADSLLGQLGEPANALVPHLVTGLGVIIYGSFLLSKFLKKYSADEFQHPSLEQAAGTDAHE